MNKLIIRMKKINKHFGHVVALDNVDFEIYENEILALVGDNGAGKSTLIKILSGLEKSDNGKIYYKGEEVKITSPAEAFKLGIGTVYQDLALVDCLDVATNIYLGREPTRWKFLVNRKKLNEDAMKIVEKIRVNIKSPKLTVGYMSGGQRQSLAVGRVISRNCDIYILDEPTAALGVRESNQVFEIIKQLKEEGNTVIIISHNLETVFNLADRIFVLRQGKKVGSRLLNETTKEEIVSMITGAYDSNGKPSSIKND